MGSWRYPDTTKRVRVAFLCPTGSDPASSVAGTSCPITPDVMITRCSAAYFLAWVRRSFTKDCLYLIDFPIDGFSPPEGRLARGFKPPAFSRFLFQSAVKSAESF